MGTEMADTQGILIGASGDETGGGPQNLLLHRANRHGIVAGATGTGKTVTLQIMAQAFSLRSAFEAFVFTSRGSSRMAPIFWRGFNEP